MDGPVAHVNLNCAVFRVQALSTATTRILIDCLWFYVALEDIHVIIAQEFRPTDREILSALRLQPLGTPALEVFPKDHAPDFNLMKISCLDLLRFTK
mgnify:CR=1 FL=1